VLPRPIQAIRYEITGASAGMSHSTFVTAGGSVYTCGDGREGKLGHNDDSIQLRPIPVLTLISQSIHAVAVQAGGSHTLALSDDGQVRGSFKGYHQAKGPRGIKTIVSSVMTSE
jgi:alpha-tubulin suppressor-like RCC1 family protein